MTSSISTPLWPRGRDADRFRRTAGAPAQEIPADQQQIVLSEDEAVRFLDALYVADQNTVARLRELR
ncbi:MAG TPA: hypothetical protein VMB05_11125 [Solirubrobacteraceae bacterium]|nr:hypothetical protein [Solirubrobacteraceae bacterium]HUB74930.1 hypothetical protein [Solirubrobacteraceae bacterium]